jgi:UPF0716 protein FxsA
MFLFLFFVIMPLIELAVFVQVAQWIGGFQAFGLLILISIVGVFIVRHEGVGVYRRVRAEIRAGIVPTVQLVDGLLILIAGVLLILPGFVTSVVGLLLLLPPVRNIAHRILRRRFSVRVANRVVKVVTRVAPRQALHRPTPSRCSHRCPGRCRRRRLRAQSPTAVLSTGRRSRSRATRRTGSGSARVLRASGPRRKGRWSRGRTMAAAAPTSPVR